MSAGMSREQTSPTLLTHHPLQNPPLPPPSDRGWGYIRTITNLLASHPPHLFPVLPLPCSNPTSPPPCHLQTSSPSLCFLPGILSESSLPTPYHSAPPRQQWQRLGIASQSHVIIGNLTPDFCFFFFVSMSLPPPSFCPPSPTPPCVCVGSVCASSFWLPLTL